MVRGGALFAARRVGKETQPGGAPALGNAASGLHAQPAKPPDCACASAPRTGPEMRQAPHLFASWVIRVVPRLVPGRLAPRRRVALHHHVPWALLTIGHRRGAVARHPRQDDSARDQPDAGPRAPVARARAGRAREGLAGGDAAHGPRRWPAATVGAGARRPHGQGQGGRPAGWFPVPRTCGTTSRRS